MYCIKCGVELENNEKSCPLCGTKVEDKRFAKSDVPPLYPKNEIEYDEMNRHGTLFVLTFVFLIPIALTLVCDLSINYAVTWSGYTVGALALGYISIVLPLWFKAPNPAIFVPADFVALIVYLFYINFAVGGNWFMTFAWPVTGMIAVIITAVMVLNKYIKHGLLYIFGGASICLGASSVVAELLMNITFNFKRGFVWSIYPLIVFSLIGIMLIIIAICRPLRESLKKKFFM